MTFERPQRDYEALFHPEELRTSLILVALYVLAYESFRDRTVEHVHMLYWCGIDESGHKYKEDEYRAAILSRNKSPFHASLDWFRKMGAIDDADLASIARLRKTRNRLVHELMRFIGTKDLAPELAAFAELARVYRKVEVWHIVNLELDGDPDWADKEIIEDEIVPGPMLMMQMLMDVALGKEDEAWQYYEGLTKSREAQGESDERAT